MHTKRPIRSTSVQATRKESIERTNSSKRRQVVTVSVISGSAIGARALSCWRRSGAPASTAALPWPAAPGRDFASTRGRSRSGRLGSRQQCGVQLERLDLPALIESRLGRFVARALSYSSLMRHILGTDLRDCSTGRGSTSSSIASKRMPEANTGI